MSDVGCAWFDRWFTARAHGDTRTAAAAASALQGSHHWPVLLQMTKNGDYPYFFWTYADATRDGYLHISKRPFERGDLVTLGCKG